jgi:hypothetical protein
MSTDLTHPDPFSASQDILSPFLVRRVNRDLDRVHARSIVTQARTQAKAEEAAAVVRARNAVAAAAAEADARLSGLLSALPISDESDPDFRDQVKKATRANVIADLYGFQP